MNCKCGKEHYIPKRDYSKCIALNCDKDAVHDAEVGKMKLLLCEEHFQVLAKASNIQTK